MFSGGGVTGSAGGTGGLAVAGPLQVAMAALLRSSERGTYSPRTERSKASISPSNTKSWQFGSSIHLALTPDPALAADEAVV